MTNGDKIRAMTDEELAAFIDIYNIEDICRTRCAKPVGDRVSCNQAQCYVYILQWLKQKEREKK